MILQSGHAVPEGALKAACEANCEESVNILVNDYKCFIGYGVLKLASLHPNQTISNVIVHGLIHRRRQLQALAEEHLPKSVRDQLRIESSSLLNIHAYEAYKLIQTTSMCLEGLLEHYRWSVFDCIGVNFDLAERLWSAGFRDVDEIDRDNQTCLTKAWRTTPPCDLEVFLQKINWLIGKGADLHHQNLSGSALHEIGNNVGSILYWMKEDNLKHSLWKIYSLSEPSKALLRTILSCNTRDDCKCACSLNGCSPMTTLLSGLLPTRTDHDTAAKLIHLFAELLIVVLFPSKLEPELDEALKNHLSIGIIRFITFKSLDITHTCLYEYRKFEPEEIKEIQDEEKLLIFDLERLLARFLEELKMRQVQLPSYITGLWRTNMASFLSTSRPHSAKEITHILELGVILDSHETQDGETFSS
ncbi:hypothetical protein N7533_007981 [Penicillium manginii]|uniref:uncharacterized protein n=1 Tax=Penicillium manginii TaxID=203109 RepID=UPI002547E511|nr:uncharacterized protein N7533_007981 [Penicillium manginii]KAJ5750953.1 hypothetical protein N7533_007981 [Penicillium manginii]